MSNWWQDSQYNALKIKQRRVQALFDLVDLDLSYKLPQFLKVIRSAQKSDLTARLAELASELYLAEQTAKRKNNGPHNEDRRADSIAHSAKRDRWG